MDIIFKAPTGARIQGTSERLHATQAVIWLDPADPSKFDWGTDYKDFPEGDSTQVFAGQTVFLCEDGEEWLARHLIPENADPLPSSVTEVMQTELLAAQLQARAEEVQQLARGLAASAGFGPVAAEALIAYSGILLGDAKIAYGITSEAVDVARRQAGGAA